MISRAKNYTSGICLLVMARCLTIYLYIYICINITLDEIYIWAFNALARKPEVKTVHVDSWCHNFLAVSGRAV